MKINNLQTCVELRSETPEETRALEIACRRSYSPRMCGLMPDDSKMVVLARNECEEFASGVLADVDIAPAHKETISKLLNSIYEQPKL